MNEQRLNLTAEWDKTFPQSDVVDHEKVTFREPLRDHLGGRLYRPCGAVANRDAAGALPAIAVCGRSVR